MNDLAKLLDGTTEERDGLEISVPGVLATSPQAVNEYPYLRKRSYHGAKVDEDALRAAGWTPTTFADLDAEYRYRYCIYDDR